MDLPIQMRIIYNEKFDVQFVWNLQTNFSIFSNQFRVWGENQNLLYNQNKSTFVLSQLFGICYCCHNLTVFIKRFVSQETPLWNNWVNLMISVQKYTLEFAHSISDIKVPCFRQIYAFFKQPFFAAQPRCCLSFFLNWDSNVS